MPINPRVRSQRLSGINPLAYVGVDPVSPTNFVIQQRAPTTQDYYNFNEGDEWLDSTTNDVWKLVNKDAQVATWVMLNGGSGGDTTYTEDSGTAMASGGILNVLGSTNINTAGAGSTININLNDTLTGLTSISVTDITADTIDAGDITADTIDVTDLTVDGTTDLNLGLGVVQSAADGTLSASNGTDGQVLIATTSSAATWANLTEGSNITITNAAGSITIAAAGTAGAVIQLHTDDGNDVTATSNTINLVGSHGLNTTGTVGPNTATIAINNAITLGDLSAIAANSNAVSATTGDMNITAGNLKLPAYNSTGTQGVIKFGGTRFIATDAVDNQWFGLNTGNLTLTGTNNTVLGAGCLRSATTASNNTLVGNVIMATSNTTGSGNTIIGAAAYNIGTSSSNTLIGASSLAKATSASNNTCIGAATGWNSVANLGLTTGTGNVLIGYNTGKAYRGAESNNILLGPLDGVISENNVFRVGNNLSAITKVFIEGIRGVTTDINDAINVKIDSAGQLGTISSSLRYKDNVKELGSLSEDIYNLSPVQFNYKFHSPESISIGLIAEEVEKVMPSLVIRDKEGLPDTVRYDDLPILLLNEIKKLRARIEALESR